MSQRATCASDMLHCPVGYMQPHHYHTCADRSLVIGWQSLSPVQSRQQQPTTKLLQSALRYQSHALLYICCMTAYIASGAWSWPSRLRTLLHVHGIGCCGSARTCKMFLQVATARMCATAKHSGCQSLCCEVAAVATDST